jgi:hypothetical protein
MPEKLISTIDEVDDCHQSNQCVAGKVRISLHDLAPIEPCDADRPPTYTIWPAGNASMMIFIMIAGFIAATIVAMHAVRTFRVWIALRGLLELPNLVQIRRIRKRDIAA